LWISDFGLGDEMEEFLVVLNWSLKRPVRMWGVGSGMVLGLV
jgi:hypothetical protein